MGSVFVVAIRFPDENLIRRAASLDAPSEIRCNAYDAGSIVNGNEEFENMRVVANFSVPIPGDLRT